MYKNFILFALLFLFNCYSIFGQTPIDVAEGTLKVGALGNEVFYYGFCEGDQLIFNFTEINGKELKEIEIVELPSSSKFMDYNTKKIENKIIPITRTGIYKFGFSNSSLGGRVCKFKIQRIPGDEIAKNFNTSVYWKTIYDTTYYSLPEKYLVSSDTVIHNLTDQIAKVHSVGNANGNKTTTNFKLPENTISWSYYIGVAQAGADAYQKSTTDLVKFASPVVSKIPGYGPLAALALGGISYLTKIQAGEDIDFYIVEGDNVNLFLGGKPFYYVKKGKVINDFSTMETKFNGSYHVCLSNDNSVTGVNVTVKITAIQVNEVWDYKQVKKMLIKSRQEAYLKD